LNHSNAPAPNERPSALPAALGLALAALLILGLGLWTATRRKTDPGSPSVTVIQPARDTVVSHQLTLRFSSSLPLSLQPTGWGAGRYHLHALVNGQERMAAAADIRTLSDSTYEWQLADLPDSARIQLVWALPNHRRLTQGASRLIRVHVRP
jgi:hypothetical protein